MHHRPSSAARVKPSLRGKPAARRVRRSHATRLHRAPSARSIATLSSQQSSTMTTRQRTVASSTATFVSHKRLFNAHAATEAAGISIAPGVFIPPPATLPPHPLGLPVDPALQPLTVESAQLSPVVHGEAIALPYVNLIERVHSHARDPTKIFMRQDSGTFTYHDLLDNAISTADTIRRLFTKFQSNDITFHNDNSDIMPRVCILAPSGFEYAVYTLGVWLAGGVAVPLHVQHAIPDMLHYLEDSQARIIVSHPDYLSTARDLLSAFDQKQTELDAAATTTNETTVAQHDEEDLSNQQLPQQITVPRVPALQPSKKLVHIEPLPAFTPSSLLSIASFSPPHRPPSDQSTIVDPFINVDPAMVPDPKKITSHVVDIVKTIAFSRIDFSGNAHELLLNVPAPSSPALFIYTSGTTSKPKGVVLKHSNIVSSIRGMAQAWGWSDQDHIMDLLPKHHIHGVINCLYTAMWSGARLTSPGRKFNPDVVWDQILAGTEPNAAPHVIPQVRLDTIATENANSLSFQPEVIGVPALRQFGINYQLPEQPQRDHEQSVVFPQLNNSSYTVFTAVPTIYHRLIAAYDGYDAPKQQRLRMAMSQFRLMMSGSMALPDSTLHRWKALSGHHLLERYGMSEVLMAVSNLYNEPRIAGSVGWPLPGVNVRVLKQSTQDYDGDDEDAAATEATKNEDGSYIGELLINGPTVFGYYFNRPKQTLDSFVHVTDETTTSYPSSETARGWAFPNAKPLSSTWFLTGDIAQIRPDGSVKLLGRNSVDILKINGTKISALEIERQLLDCPMISSVAVVGLPSQSSGQSIAAIIVPKHENGAASNDLSLESLQQWAKGRMTHYPREIDIVDSIPTNAMGKINKKLLVKQLLERPEFSQSSFRQ